MSESVRRDLRDMSAFRDQQRPGAAAANGHAPVASHDPRPDGMADPEVCVFVTAERHLLTKELSLCRPAGPSLAKCVDAA